MLVSTATGTVPSATGTLDITGDLGGELPRAAILYGIQAAADDTQSNAYSLTVAATDGVEMYYVNCRAKDNATTTVTQRAAGEGMQLYKGHFGVPTVVMTFKTWIADGIRLDVTSTDTYGWQIRALLLGGNDLQAKVGKIDINGLNVVSTATIGFETLSAFLFSACWDIRTPGQVQSSNSSEIALGFYGTGAQSYSRKDSNAEAKTTLGASIRPYALSRQDIGDSAAYRVQLDNVTSTSFDLTPKVHGASDTIAYLALNIPATVDVIDTATGTGNTAHTIGFRPLCIVSIPNTLSAVDTLKNNTDADGLGFGITTASDEFSAYTVTDQGVSPSKSRSGLRNYIKMPTSTTVAGIAAKFVSMDSTGWTWNYSATSATVRKWPVWVFEDTLASVPSPPAATLKISGPIPLILKGGAAPKTQALVIDGYQAYVVQSNTGIPNKSSLKIVTYKPTIGYTANTYPVTIRTAAIQFIGYAPSINQYNWNRRHEESSNAWYPLEDRQEKYSFFD